MIQNRTGDGWAQSGTLRRAGYHTRHFAQYYTPNYGQDTVYDATDLEDGQIYQYWTGYVERNVSGTCDYGLTKCLNLRVNTTTLTWTTFNPTVIWAQPWITAYAGETTYKGSDVPGRPTGRVRFNNMKHQDSTTTWAAQPYGTDVKNSQPAYWAHYTIDNDTREIWTEVFNRG
jgi:hypothetical protein